MKDREKASDTLIIGLTGTNGSGKGTIAAMLREAGWAYYSLSDVIRKELARRGAEETVDRMARIGNDMRREGGAHALAARVFSTLREDKATRAVADSIRNAAEVEFFKRVSHFVFLAVDAPIDLRHKRVMARNRPGDRVSLKAFIDQEQRQMAGGEGEQHLLACINLADIAILNEGTEEDLRQRVTEGLRGQGISLF